MINESFTEPEEIACPWGVAGYDYGGIDLTVRALRAPPIGLAADDRFSRAIKERGKRS